MRRETFLPLRFLVTACSHRDCSYLAAASHDRVACGFEGEESQKRIGVAVEMKKLDSTAWTLGFKYVEPGWWCFTCIARTLAQGRRAGNILPGTVRRVRVPGTVP